MVVLGGRTFALCDLDAMTFAQSQWLAAHADKIGIDAIWPRDGESDAAYEARLRCETVLHGDVPALLAGYLLADGRSAWLRRDAESVQKHLESLTDPAEHSRMAALAARVAPDFFGRALALFGISQISSTSANLGEQRNMSVAH